jgi:hypothetical protein
MTASKAILIGAEPGAGLASHLATLSLPRRALTLALNPGLEPAFAWLVELWGDDAAVRATVSDWPLPVRAWLVEEHAPLVYERTWPSGTPSPGVRMLSSLHRRSDIRRAAFAAHWLGRHADVARSYTVPVWHYNQNVVVEALTPGSDEDGFVGMHFENAEQLRARWADHPAEAARGAADAALFIDATRTVSMVGKETVWEDPC